MAILKVDTITSADTPTVSITDGASISGVTTFSSDINIADKIVHTGDTDTAIRFSGADTVSIETAGSERLSVSSAGLVSLPVAGNLQVGGAGSGDTDTKVYVANTGGNAYIQVKGADSSGIVGLKFGRNSVANRAGIDWSAATDALSVRTGGTTERLRITSGGLVGVGTATPGSLLHLGADSATAQLRIQRTNEAANTNDYGRIYWASYGGTLTGQLSVARESAENNGYMWFGTASSGTLTEKVRITSAGQLQIAPAGSAKMSFYHDSGGSLNHITSNNGNEIKVSSGNGNSNGIEFWDYTGVNKRCQIDAEGIKFNTDTAAANGLDDYEEGSWTLVPTCETGSVTLHNQVNECMYTKIGKMVNISGRIRFDSVSGQSGWIRFTLPFANASSGPDQSALGQIPINTHDLNLNSAALSTWLELSSGNAYASVICQQDNGSWFSFNCGDLKDNDNEYIAFSGTYQTDS